MPAATGHMLHTEHGGYDYIATMQVFKGYILTILFFRGAFSRKRALFDAREISFYFIALSSSILENIARLAPTHGAYAVPPRSMRARQDDIVIERYRRHSRLSSQCAYYFCGDFTLITLMMHIIFSFRGYHAPRRRIPGASPASHGFFPMQSTLLRRRQLYPRPHSKRSHSERPMKPPGDDCYSKINVKDLRR